MRAGGRRRLVSGLLVAACSCALVAAIWRGAALQGKPGLGAVFILVVCLSAVVGGPWAGLFAALLSLLTASWFLIEPTHSLAPTGDKLVFGIAVVLAAAPMVFLLERGRRVGEGLRLGSLRLSRDLDARRAADERRRFLADASEQLNSSLDFDETQRRLGALAVPALADWCRIELTPAVPDRGSVDAQPQSFEYGAVRAGVVDRGELPAATERALASRNASLDERVGSRSAPAMVVPLLVGDRTVGTMVFVRTDRTQGAYDEADLSLANELARRAATALENARVHGTAELARDEAQTAVARVRRLQTVIDATFTSSSSDEFLDQLLERLCEAIGADAATILTVAEGETLVVRRFTGYTEPAGVRTPFGIGFAGQIAATRTHQVGRHLGPSEFGTSQIGRTGIVSAAGAPLITGEKLVGVLQVGCREQCVFDEEDVMLLRLVAARVAIALDRSQVYDRGQSIAESLQRSLLPGRFPTIEGVETAARYVPGTFGLEVGGDWYDVFELADGSIAISVGDVMGRGVYAAATMSQLRNVMRAYALEGLAPGETLDRLNHLALDSELFATVVYAIVSPSRTTLAIANAGHPPPLIASPGEPVRRLVEGASPPIGTVIPTSFVDAEVTLPPESSLVFYTDGLVELRGESIDTRIDRLAEIVDASDEPVHQLIDTILDEFELDEHPDDRALLVVRFGGPAAERMSLRFPPDSSALALARNDLRGWLRDRGAHDDEIFDIVLAVNEACSNAVEHPLDVQGDEIQLAAELTAGRVAIVVNDGGRWKTESDSRYRGRGIQLMHSLMEKVDVVQSSDGTSVRLERAISGEPTWSVPAA